MDRSGLVVFGGFAEGGEAHRGEVCVGHFGVEGLEGAAAEEKGADRKSVV